MKLADIIAKRKEQSESRKMKNDKAYSFKEGVTRFRILPGWRKDDDTFFHDFGMHFVKDDQGKNVAVHVCPKATYEQECPTCQAINEAFGFVRENPDASDDSMIERLKEANSGSRILMNVIIRAESGNRADDIVTVLDMPRAAFETNVLEMFEEYGEELLDVNEGLDIICTATGRGFDRKYAFVPASKKTNVPTVTPAQLDQRADIDKWIKAQNWEQERVQKAISAVGSMIGLEYSAGSVKAALPNRSNLSVAAVTNKARPNLDDMLDDAIEDAAFDEDIIMDHDGTVHASVEDADAKAEKEAAAKAEKEAAEAAAKAKAEADEIAVVRAQAVAKAKAKAEADAKAKAQAKAEAEEAANRQKVAVGSDVGFDEETDMDDLDDLLADL